MIADTLFMTVLVLAALLVFTVAVSFFIISTLVNKLMSRNYFEYLDSKKNLKKPKTELIIEEQVPTENLARIL
jgi:hypothetical protein